MIQKEILIKAFEVFFIAILATSAQAAPADKNSTKPDDTPTNRIINGNTGSWANYPSLVSLRVNGGHSCGGALLNANTVLTASHCSEVSPGSVSHQQPQAQAQSGPDGSYTEHRVSQIIKHPNYSSGGYIQYDVAIWKLATPVSARNFYQIDTQNTGNQEGASTRFAGWGRVDPNDQYRLASRLQEANLPVYSFDSCNAAYQGLSKPHHLCAGYREGRSAVCQGDSGGPLVIGNTIIGVTSFVKDLRCLNPDFPSVFARVNTYAQWIQQYVR
ncbi:trypsin-like serine protease [Neoconidiobolus thromboides FSU 785]|nr:trypsin-like serine protease [Neoconidiobolus thromboides FSU 785]